MSREENIQRKLDKFRKENIDPYLRDIYDQSLNKRVKTFQPPFKGIVQILEEMGENIFTCIKEQSNFEKYSIDYFNFYFWSGYTTLDGRRVFIEGKQTGRENQEKYFTGIGKQYDVKNKSSISFHDCPSTIAFDRVLNSKYFLEEYNPLHPGDEYYPGTTHFFRLTQTRNIKGKVTYIPLKNFKRSKNESYEEFGDFKILDISIENEKFILSKHPNIFRIHLDKNRLHESGAFIYKELKNFLEINSKMNSNVDILDEYTNWPFNAYLFRKDNLPPSKIKGIDKKLNEIQIHLYSYWIGETLQYEANFDLNKFRKIIQRLAQENPNYLDLFKFLIDNLQRPRNLTEIFFSSWYTIFHESFTPNEDLGSTMLLSNLPIRYEFLITIDNWITNVFRDLKLIETKTRAEVESQRKNINILKHSQGQFINAQIDFIDGLESITEEERVILRTHIEFISGYLDISESFEALDQRKYYSNKVNIASILNTVLYSISILLKTPKKLSKSLKSIGDPAKYSDNIIPIINDLIEKNSNKAVLVFGEKYKISLLLKELLVNFLENVNQNSPFFDINIKQADGMVSITFENNIDDRWMDEAKYNLIREGSFLEGKFGWRVIFAILKDHGWHFEVPNYADVLSRKKFSFTLIIL